MTTDKEEQDSKKNKQAKSKKNSPATSGKAAVKRSVKLAKATAEHEIGDSLQEEAANKLCIKTYILDTNVLLSDGNVLSAFDEHNIVIPYIVLEEMDRHKDRPDEVGRNAREFVRKLKVISTDIKDMRHWFSRGPKLGMMKIISIGDIEGWDINKRSLPIELQSHHTGDNTILEFCMAYSANEECILVSRDTVLRIKCKTVGIPCEDYRKLNVVASASSLYSGILECDDLDVQELYSMNGQEAAAVLPENVVNSLKPNEFLSVRNGQSSYLARFTAANRPLKPVSGDYGSSSKIKPRNREQRLAYDLLYDENVKLVTLTGKAGCGKAQPLDAKILTPTGWTTMGELKVGDQVIARNGMPTTVTGVFPQGEKDIYRVNFSEGSSAECCDDHLWHTRTVKERDYHKPGQVRTLKEIRNSMVGPFNKKNHSIPMVDTIEFSSQPVPLDPYFLGVVIGDGSISQRSCGFTSADQEIVDEMVRRLPENCLLVKLRNKYGYAFKDSRKTLEKHNTTLKAIMVSPTGEECELRSTGVFSATHNISVSGLCHLMRGNWDKCKGWTVKQLFATKPDMRNKVVAGLQELGLHGHKSDTKFVPDIYKYNSPKIRLEMLQGLMDTDGTVSKDGMGVTFSTTSKQLANDVQELVWSFGGKATISNKQTYFKLQGVKKAGLPSFVIHISLPPSINPFKLSRKANLVVPRTKYQPTRYITAVEHVGKRLAQCISVADSEHLYVTDNYVVTHNTMVALDAGLETILNKRLYSSLVICRPVMPVGKDIGFLPGGLSEKMEPWMAPIKDNLRFILNAGSSGSDEKSSGGKKAKRSSAGGGFGGEEAARLSDKGHLESILQSYFDEGIIEIQPLTYIRGRSISNAFIIVDEAQNTSLHEIKTILTRAGEGTKIVLVGDIEQIDRNDVDSVSNGLTTVVEKFKDSPIAGHVSLVKGERSQLATIAAEILG